MRAFTVVRTVVLVVDGLGVVIDVVVVVPSYRAVVVVLQWCAEAKALVVAPVELVLVAVVIRGSLAVWSDVEQNTSQKYPELEPTNACRCMFSCILRGNKTMLSLP